MVLSSSSIQVCDMQTILLNPRSQVLTAYLHLSYPVHMLNVHFLHMILECYFMAFKICHFGFFLKTARAQ